MLLTVTQSRKIFITCNTTLLYLVVTKPVDINEHLMLVTSLPVIK